MIEISPVFLISFFWQSLICTALTILFQWCYEQKMYQACALSNEKLLVLPSFVKELHSSKKYCYFQLKLPNENYIFWDATHSCKRITQKTLRTLAKIGGTWVPLVPLVPLRASSCSPSRFGNLRIKCFRALYWPLRTTATLFGFILGNSNLPENIFLHQGRHCAKRHVSANNVLKVRIYTV